MDLPGAWFDTCINTFAFVRLPIDDLIILCEPFNLLD